VPTSNNPPLLPNIPRKPNIYKKSEAISIHDYTDPNNNKKNRYQDADNDEDGDLNRNIDELDPQDLEFEDKAWEIERAEIDSKAKKPTNKGIPEKKGSSKVNFLKSLGDHAKKSDDFALDGPDTIVEDLL
jgi:hypothetical protein